MSNRNTFGSYHRQLGRRSSSSSLSYLRVMVPQAGNFFGTLTSISASSFLSATSYLGTNSSSTVLLGKSNPKGYVVDRRRIDDDNINNMLIEMASRPPNDVVLEDLLEKNYIALFLLIIPMLTIFGNALVVISVIREKALQTTTNFLIASLAISDFLVAFCVMPFAVYVVVENSMWNLPKLLCNIYIAADVCASTASILNLVAVSWDRYMAISKPIEYARNSKNNIRVKATIFVVWFVSLAIALPVVTGLNNLDDTHHCEFTNATYIVASSLGSFYLPCIVMVILYSIVLKNLRKRRRIRKKQKPKLGRVIATIGKQKVAEIELDYVTVDSTTKQDANVAKLSLANDWESLQRTSITIVSRSKSLPFEPDIIPFIDAAERENIPKIVNVDNLENYFTPSIQPSPQSIHHYLSANGNLGENNNNIHRKLAAMTPATSSTSMQQIGRKHFYKFKESKQIRKETKATQTLAIVLAVFLLCWLPFFICHLTNSVCMLRYENMCIPIMAFFLTTWLGYMNSFMNPVIYTVFNAEYRKAFYNILIRKRRRRYMIN